MNKSSSPSFLEITTVTLITYHEMGGGWQKLKFFAGRRACWNESDITARGQSSVGENPNCV